MADVKAQLNAEIRSITAKQRQITDNLSDLAEDLVAAWDDWYSTKVRSDNMTNLSGHDSVPISGLVQMFKDSLKSKHTKLISLSDDYTKGTTL